jgi:hypothetical protein
MIIHKALLLMTDGIILLILCSYLLLAFWSWMKEGNIIVSVHMAKAGALTRLSGWKTEGSCCNAQHGQGLSSLQHPDWLWGAPSLLFIGDLVLVVCGRGVKLTAWYLQHLHNFTAHKQWQLYHFPPPPLSLSLYLYHCLCFDTAMGSIYTLPHDGTHEDDDHALIYMQINIYTYIYIYTYRQPFNLNC